MKKITPYFLVLFLSLFWQTTVWAGVDWEKDFKSAVARSKKENKLLFVHFYTPYCGYCKRLQQETFPHAKVQKEFVNFVVVKVDVQSERAIGQQYQVRGVPDNRVYTPGAAQLILHLRGFMEAHPFADNLRQTRTAYADFQQKIGRFNSVVSNNEEKSRLALDIGKIYYSLEDYNNANSFFSKSGKLHLYYKKDPIIHKMYGFALMARGDFQKSIDQYHKYLKHHSPSSGEEYWNVRFLLAYSQMQLGKHEDALQNFELVKNNSKSDAIKKDARYLHSKVQYLLHQKHLKEKGANRSESKGKSKSSVEEKGHE